MRPRLGPTVAFRLGIRDREAARHAVERILEWDFDRILPGHGEVVETGGKDKFKRDFAWLLRWSAPPMRSRPSCTRSDWSPPAPGTSLQGFIYSSTHRQSRL